MIQRLRVKFITASMLSLAHGNRVRRSRSIYLIKRAAAIYLNVDAGQLLHDPT